MEFRLSIDRDSFNESKNFLFISNHNLNSSLVDSKKVVIATVKGVNI